MKFTESADVIKKSSRLLLQECNLKEPPLDLDRIYEYVQLERYGQFFKENSNWKNQNLPQNIRAILDVNERLVIINYDAHEKQQQFASVHEVGHFILPWQKELLYFCSIWDLNVKTRKLFEQEANFFAAETLFFGNLYTQEIKDLPFGMKTIVYLAARFEVSLESAARRYVEINENACALLVSKPIKTNELLSPPSTQLAYYHLSPSFPHRFKYPQIFPSKHVLSKTCSSCGDIYSGKLDFNNERLHYESLFTTYTVLTLVGKPELFK